MSLIFGTQVSLVGELRHAGASPSLSDSTPSRSLGTLEEVVGNYGGSQCEPESEPVGGKKNKRYRHSFHT